MSIANQTDFFLNFQQFGELKLRARESDDAQLDVARQFEGLFLQQMLQAMRAASEIDPNQHSSSVDFYQEMFDKQLAQIVAGQDGLGVARMIVQQLPSTSTEASRPSGPLAPPETTVAATATAVPAEVTSSEQPESLPATGPNVLLNPVLDDDFAEVNLNQAANPRWDEPQQFIADIWPAARSAAGELGISPGLLVAQAALETGWGKHTMKFDDGRNSYNLFGIKAGSNWSGQSLLRSSLEFDGDRLNSEVSRFRAYASAADSLRDYVQFIQSSPRYGAALQSDGDDHVYIREIHRAGYATDPDYADKVIAILNSDLLEDSIASLAAGENQYA